MGGAFHPCESLENFRLTESKTYSMMCARRGSQGVKTRDTQDAEKAPLPVGSRALFFCRYDYFVAIERGNDRLIFQAKTEGLRPGFRN